MRMWKKIVTILTLAVLMATSPVISPLATGMTEAQKEKQALEQELKEAQELIKGLKNSKDNIETKVHQLDEQLTNISMRINELENQLDQKQMAIEDAATSLAQAQEDANHQYDLMKKRIKYMYEKEASMSLISSLFTAGNFTEFINRAEYIKAITDYDREMLAKYQNTQEYVASTKEALENDYQELAELKEQVQIEQQVVHSLMTAKEEELGDIKDDISDAQQTADVVQAEIDAQKDIIAQIQAEEARKAAAKKAADEAAAKAAEEAAKANENQDDTEQPSEGDNNTITPPADDTYSGGAFVWPVPSSKRVTSDFGVRLSPTAGASSNHQGIDIGADYGASIVAAADGNVVFAGYSSGMGNYLMIGHGSGIYTVYGHCSTLLVAQGATVTAGQAVAQIGSTGISTGNHLHFGVSSGGSYVSPWNYLSK